MIKFLQHLYWKWRLANVRNQLESRLRNECDVVEIQVGKLTLTSLSPDKKRTGALNGQEVEFYCSTWDGEAFFPFWGGRLPVMFSASAPRLEQHQLKAIQSILNHPVCIRPEVESALFSYYESEVYHDGAKNLDGNALPKPSDHKQVRKLLGGPTIYPESFAEAGDLVSFNLHFDCDWDEEHGVSVDVVDWKITRVGM